MSREKSRTIICSGIFGLLLAIITITGTSIALAQQPFIITPNQTNTNNSQSSNVFYKGPSLIGVRVYDYFKSAEWQVVQNYLSQGFQIKAVVPASQLPNSGSTMGLLVILEKS